MRFTSRNILLPISLFFLSWQPALCWQQDVAYQMVVTLDVENHTLEGSEVLTYRNNSPDTLTELWIHLYPNAYKNRESEYAKEMEQMGMYKFSFASPKERGWIDIASLTSEGKDLQYQVDGTRMAVKLAEPLEPGEELSLEIEFCLKIPKIFSRLGHKGKHYEMSQWYPKVVVYDAQGWHPDGYHALGEFYGEFGTYDVWITLPANMVVGATGVLLGPDEEMERLQRLAAGEKLKEKKGSKTLHFRAEKVHDFAWIADSEYGLITGRQDETEISVYYLPKHKKAWGEVLDYAKDALKYYGGWYGKYPYSTLTVADGYLGAGGGMEYPNLVIISVESPSVIRLLELVVMHEIGHQWFYGLLGSNEMDETWLDEGINSFSELRYMEEKYDREGNLFNWPEWLRYLPSFGDRWLQQVAYYLAATNHAEKPILTPAHRFVQEPVAYQAAGYSKAAWVVDMLRYVLTDDVFDAVMRTYVQRYSYKHPHTGDFIAVAEEMSGRELDWFFDQWLRTTGQCDYAMKRVQRKGERTEVSVERLGEVVMPVDVLLETRDGEKHIKRWEGREKLKVLDFATAKPVKRAVIDPDNRVLEVNKWNNRAPKKISFHPIFAVPSFDSYQIFYGPYGGLSSVDKLRLGGYLRGGEFVDFGFVKGRHNWEFTLSAGLKTRRWFYDLAYRTPLYFSKNRVRLSLGLSDYYGERKQELGLSVRLGKKVLSPPEHLISLGLGLSDLWTQDYIDDRDYSEGKLSSGSASYSYKFCSRNVAGSSRLDFTTAKRVLRGERSFDRFSLESSGQFRFTKRIRFKLRGFLGCAFGDVPAQEQFFLCGALRATGLSTVVISRKGTLSPQERWHIEGGGNLRGYFGRHIHNNVLASLSIDAPLGRVPLTPLQSALFFDIGNAWNDLDSVDGTLRSDLGLTLSLGPLSVSFPFWISHPQAGENNLAFRWILGFSQTFGPTIGM